MLIAYLRFLADYFSTPLGMGFLGLIFGSFVNMLAYRLPLIQERQWWSASLEQMRDRDSWRAIVASRLPVDTAQLDAASERLAAVKPVTLTSPSSCPRCGHVIRWHENIPVLSWMMLRGKCSSCREPIGWLYPMGEALCGLACFGFALQAQGTVVASHALVWVVYVAILMAAAQVDLRSMVLPDVLTLPLLWAGIGFAAIGIGPVTVLSSLAGLACGYGVFFAIAWCFAIVTGKNGLGLGDVKLFAALGAWLGPAPLILVALGAAASSVVFAMLRGRRADQQAPFGPFLALAGCVVALARPTLAWLLY